MALHQAALASALPVPVATSSVLLVSLVDRLLGRGRRAGILTVSAAALTAAHLTAVGASADTPIGGLPADGHFADVFLRDGTSLDPGLARAELLQAAERLIAARPEVGALVLECTNMGSHTAALAQHTGLPVFDVISLAIWLRQGLFSTGQPLAKVRGVADPPPLSNGRKSASRS
jgi:Asp/Glu/hydantoin racemase